MARHIPFTATPEEILDALFNHDTRGSGSSSPLDRDGSRGASAGRDVHICEPQARLGQPVAPSSSTVTSPAPRVHLNKEEECADSTWKPKLTTPNPATFVVRKRGLLFISKIAGTRSIANFLQASLPPPVTPVPTSCPTTPTRPTPHHGVQTQSRVLGVTGPGSHWYWPFSLPSSFHASP